MKIPGYKHLIEDVLPDINLYLDTINMKVFRKTGEKFKSNVTEFRGVNEKNIFVFKTSEGNIIEWDFNTIYIKDRRRHPFRIIQEGCFRVLHRDGRYADI